MIKKVQAFIDKNNLIDKKAPLVIALSGGIDSMVLFDILYQLGYSLVIAHVNHNVREESFTEQRELKQFALEKKVPFETVILPKLSGNFQEKARRLRYDFLFSICEKYHTKQMVTAHHLDDLAETILMKITRGSNMLGYSGIRMKTEVNNITIVRPLLALTKEEITNYQKINSLLYFEDASNQTDHYTRNRFRHHIIPLLKEENPNLYQELIRFQEAAFLSFNHIRQESKDFVSSWGGIIDIKQFQLLDICLQTDIIQMFLEESGIPEIASKKEAVLLMLKRDKPNSSIDLGNNKRFIRSYNKAYISSKLDHEEYEIVIDEYKYYDLPNGDQILYTKKSEIDNPNYVNLCYNRISELPLRVRSRKEGDIISFDYGKKKVKKLLIEKKIPLDERDIIPICVDNKGNIVGIIGIGPKKGDNKDYLYWIRRNKE